MRKIVLSSVILLLWVFIILINNGCKVNESVSAADQLKKDTLAIDKYLMDHNITNYQRNSSGVRYVVSKLGTGFKTNIHGGILVRYVGKLMSGEEFDTTYRNKSARFVLNNVIDGWKIAFQLISSGTKATLYIPSVLAYGSVAQSGSNLLVPIPANSNLIFEVELLDVIPSPDFLQLQKDINKIDKYLADNTIVATKVKDSNNGDTGLRYVIVSDGNGSKPILQNKIVVQYVGKLMSSGVIFDQTDLSSDPNNTTKHYLNATIRGWQLGFQYFNKGSKVNLYVPSGLAYGSYPILNENGSIKIPANSNLIFEINFLNITN